MLCDQNRFRQRLSSDKPKSSSLIVKKSLADHRIPSQVTLLKWWNENLIPFKMYHILENFADKLNIRSHLENIEA